MSRKLTITIDDEVYQGLYEKVGARRIARFIQELVRPHVVAPDLEASYADMAAQEERERDASEWADELAPSRCSSDSGSRSSGSA